ncbi:MAG: 16S rRNA (cytosine(1402)-N(4))-methyltransferase RsmH [Planctomycetes bacterium]|nr:16S rRNA (cytosine(1402)-N(4))-methyltransferase RsmH [Planctomycetota bacterium]
MSPSGRDDDEDDDDVAEAPDDEPEQVFTHAPVLRDEVLDLLAPGPDAVLYDLTLGLGGHVRAFLERAGPGARAFGLDADPLAVERSTAALADLGARVTLAHASLREVGRVARERGWPAPTAVLMDLGLSSPQIEEAARGFSYRREGPLDMRFDPTRGPTAAELLLALPSAELAERVEVLGDEPLAGEIVKLIKRRLPVETTTQLAAIVLEAYGRRSSRVHPARRTFQALRMLVNDELAAIEEGLWDAVELLAPGGRAAAISFHSGEDRVVKEVLRNAARRGLVKVLTRRPVRPTETECLHNQRARSAKLRGVERV